MRVLIMSVTAGEGHNAAAESIRKQLEERGAECRVIDTLKYISKPLAKTISEGYLFVSKDMKYGYEMGYRIAEKRRGNADSTSVARISNMIISSKMRKYIDSYDPDVIVFTHVFAGVILDVLKVKGRLRAKAVGILTDFMFHPFWEECIHLDYVVTPNEQLLYQAKKKGFSPEQIVPSGIPINPKFARSLSKEEARAALGLDKNKDTVLMMGGSMGYGNIKKVLARIDALDPDFQIIVVCGNNKSMHKSIAKMNTKKKVLNLGFVNNVDQLMDASDCIVSKPGGLTTSEALAKRLPMIIMNPIPGQESRNTEFLINQGVALAPTDAYTLEEALWSMLSSPDKREVMRDNIELLRKPDSSADLCDFVMNLGEKA